MTASTLGSAAPARDRPSRWADAAARAGSASWRGLRTGLGVIRPAAWVLIVAAAVLWVAGESLGWWELTVAAVVLTVVLVVCALLLIGRTAYDVGLDLNRTRVVVGERAVGALTLANAGRRAILPSRVVLPVGAGRGVFAVQRLAPGASVEELFAIPTSRRGVLAVGPVSVVRGDPLGLFERVHRRDEPVDLFVHPRTVLFEGQSLGFLRDLEGLPATDLSRDDVSFHALREYVPGDDLRHVHWRSTARRGHLMMRQNEARRRTPVLVMLDVRPGSHDRASFERAVEACASIVTAIERSARPVEVMLSTGRMIGAPGRRHLGTVMDELAVVEPHGPDRIVASETRYRSSAIVAIIGRAQPNDAAALGVLVRDGGQLTVVECMPEAVHLSLRSRRLRRTLIVANGADRPFPDSWNEAVARWQPRAHRSPSASPAPA